MDPKKITPAAESVSVVQQQLAMISIRKSRVANTPESVQELKESLYALYHNLGRSDKEDAAILAHIAWASRRLGDNGYGSVDINQYLDKALILDSSSVYANTYKGYLYLGSSWNRDNGVNLSDQDLVAKAQQHFKVALAQSVDLNYVRGLQLSALKSRENLASASEYVKLILVLYANKDAFFEKHSKKITTDVESLFYAAFKSDDKAFMDKVFLSLSKPEVGLLKEVFDFIPNKRHEQNAGQGYALSYSVLLAANISEKEGDYSRAIKEYIDGYNIVKDTMSGFRYRIPKVLKVICSSTEMIGPESKTVCDKFFEHTVDSRHSR